MRYAFLPKLKGSQATLGTYYLFQVQNSEYFMLTALFCIYEKVFNLLH